MNFLKKFIGASAIDDVALIPSGKLFLARSPRLPKGALECLYNDAYITIKQTTTPFLYQLVVIRAYQEGEASSHSNDETDEDDGNEGHSLEHGNTDERVFFLAHDLKVRVYTKDNGTKVIAWKDLNGDIGDLFEFVVDEEIKYHEVDHFMAALYKCLYELKYQKPSVGAELEQLSEFVYDPKTGDEDEPDLHGLNNLRDILYLYGNAEEEGDEEDEEDEEDDDEEYEDFDRFSDALSIPNHLFSKKLDISGEEAFSGEAEFRIFNPDTDSFQLIASKITVKIVNVKDVGFSLASDTKNYYFCIQLSQEMNPAFNFEHNVFIFNYYYLNTGDSSSGITSVGSTAYSLMFKFTNFEELNDFQVIFFKAMYSAVAQSSATQKASDSMEYISDAFGRIDVSTSGGETEDFYDAEEYAEAALDDDDEEAISKIVRDKIQSKDSRVRGLFVSSDSEDDYDDEIDAKKERKFLSTRFKNSGLAVGQANDRSYVTRGDSLGVYKRDEEGLGFSTNIAGLKDLSGKKLLAKRTMLHQRDNTLLLTKDDPTDTKIYKMDLKRGEVIEEWDADDKEQLASFAPISKFAGLTNEQLLNGLSANTLFRIDPRLSGKKIVKDNTFKAYKTKKNGFEMMTVTEQGYIAVGLTDGTIRLYDRFGVNAKTSLPSLGEPFINIDVSRDGRWLLATCKTYLLLIDLKVGKGQKNAGSLGFKDCFDADKKPVPKRLALRPEHVTQLSRAANNQPLNFTKAVFNSLLTSKETTIVTSTGPFVILWSLTNITKNWKREPAYKILRYNQQVVADNFLVDSQNDVVSVLQDEVSLVNKNGFKRVSKTNIVQEYS